MEENKKLDTEKMEQVSGGNWGYSNPFYESKDTPRYQVGQTVLDRFYILAINEGKSGLIHKEFTYVVVEASDHSKVYAKKMYESELMRKEGLWINDPMNKQGL